MPSVSGPYGLVPAFHPNGLVRPVQIRLTKALMEATPTLFHDQPVALDPTGRLAQAANAADWCGVFYGVEYQDLTGRPIVQNTWTNGVLVRDLGNDSARVYFTRDPEIVYKIQASAAMGFDDIGEQAAFLNIANGNTTTGLSSASLDQSTVSSAQNMMKVHNIDPSPFNDWTDNFPDIQVQIARHQEVAAKAGF